MRLLTILTLLLALVASPLSLPAQKGQKIEVAPPPPPVYQQPPSYQPPYQQQPVYVQPAPPPVAPPIYAPPAPQIIVAPPPEWYGQTVVTLSTDRAVYELGAQVAINARANQDAFLFVYSTDSRGVTRQLLPNYFDRDNFVYAHQIKQLPSPAYSLLATSEGWDTIRVVAVAAERAHWSPPPQFYRATSRDPFPICVGGYSEIQTTLQASLEVVFNSSRRGRGSSGSLKIEVGGPSRPVYPGPVYVEAAPPPPRWGEAFAQVYVRPAVFAPPPPPVVVYPGPRPPVIVGPRPIYLGSISVSTAPSNADVFVNGQYQGSSPLTVELPPGAYDVEARRPGYRPWVRRLYLEEGARERYRVQLNRDRNFY